MSSPIHFMGEDYASVDDMPADIRTLYDKSAGKGSTGDASKARKSAKSTRRSQPWKQAKSGGIAVPEGFQNVSGLGPVGQIFMVGRDRFSGARVAVGAGLVMSVIGGGLAAGGLFVGTVQGDADTGWGLAFGGLLPLIVGIIVLLNGLRQLLSLWLGIQELVTYRDGFAFRTRRGIHVWTWAEIASILSKEVLHINPRGSNWTSLTYQLSKQNGETVSLSNAQFQDINNLIDIVKRRAFAALRPAYQQAYEAGQPVTFGAVTVSQPDGLTADGRCFAWSDIEDVKVKHGRLVISTRQAGLLGGVHQVRASKIPNIEILCQLMGIDPWSIDLTYI